MTNAVNLEGQFTVVGGNETPIREPSLDGEPRLTHVSGSQRFDSSGSAALEGSGSVEWLFAYRPDRSASFTGFQRFEGSIDGRRGSFLMLSTGTHDGARSRGEWSVVTGSGTGELAGVRGRGSFDAPGGRVVDYELDLELP